MVVPKNFAARLHLFMLQLKSWRNEVHNENLHCSSILIHQNKLKFSHESGLDTFSRNASMCGDLCSGKCIYIYIKYRSSPLKSQEYWIYLMEDKGLYFGCWWYASVSWNENRLCDTETRQQYVLYLSACGEPMQLQNKALLLICIVPKTVSSNQQSV